MSLQVYKDFILGPHVEPWIQRGDNFVLEEDGDSIHGTIRQKSSIVPQMKAENILKYYFNL